MLQSLKQVTYPVNNMNRAESWYGSVLERKPVFTSPFATVFTVDDCTLTLTEGAGQSTGSVAYWAVNDIDAAYRRLLALGAEEHTPVQSVMQMQRAKVVDPFGNVLGITAPEREQPVTAAPSQTAMTTAFCRALAFAEGSGKDSHAASFLDEKHAPALQSEQAMAWAKEQLGGIYGSLKARTAYGDQLFARALKDGLPQVVLLGAGYDSRALRFADQLGATQVYEVDAPTTQRRKLATLEAAGTALPPQLTTVSIDFNSEILIEKLREAGYNPCKQTLFIWEGVTPYLPEEAIEEVLMTVRHHAPKGSRLFCDILTEERDSQVADEPFRFWSTPEAMQRRLLQHGLITVDTLKPEQMDERFGCGEVAPCFSFVYGVRE